MPDKSLPRVSAQLATFFHQFRFRLELLEQTRVHTDRLLATRFNVFDYVAPDENLLSAIIADLLDPRGDHGQGDVFLRLFLTELCGVAAAEMSRVCVTREHCAVHIDRNRRIDVVIGLDGLGVGIENKPWAQDQPDQVNDYVAHMRREFPRGFVIVYLSPDGGPPESLPTARRRTLLAQRRLREIAYPEHFCAWLELCRKECRAEKVRSFLEDFGRFIETTFPRIGR
jgi:hypothetical protein